MMALIADYKQAALNSYLETFGRRPYAALAAFRAARHDPIEVYGLDRDCLARADSELFFEPAHQKFTISTIVIFWNMSLSASPMPKAVRGILV